MTLLKQQTLPLSYQLPLEPFASPDTSALESIEQAEQILKTLQQDVATSNYQRVELDFTGIENVSELFTETLFNQSRQFINALWLVPRNYNNHIRSHLHQQLMYLQNCREHSWREASLQG